VHGTIRDTFRCSVCVCVCVCHCAVTHPYGRKGCRFAVLAREKPAPKMMMITNT
jgi:hypothetical protein